MTPNFSYLEPGELLPKAIATATLALEKGALQPIATEREILEAGNIQFEVRILANLRRKQAATQHQVKTATNPFLPYDRDLFVADLSPSHLCLLNKFNAVENHLLLVTRTFENQQEWLNLADFKAAALCLRDIDGLVFYNGGTLAGSSQPHKHLQLIPLPSIRDGKRLPIDPAIATACFEGNLGKLSNFAFVHGLAGLNGVFDLDVEVIAPILLEKYHFLLKSVGLPLVGTQQTGAYNLLLTRQWMMLVLRSQSSFQSIEVNSLGFAGALLVRDSDRLAQLKTLTPLGLLHAVTHKI